MDLSAEINSTFVLITIALALGIYILTFIVRIIYETCLPTHKDSKYWREMILPLMPIFWGIGIGFVSAFPWPTVFEKYLLIRCMYSAACGLFSGWVYGRVMSYLNSLKDEVVVSKLGASTPVSNTPADPQV